jgi:hypothetical protein
LERGRTLQGEQHKLRSKRIICGVPHISETRHIRISVAISAPQHAANHSIAD